MVAGAGSGYWKSEKLREKRRRTFIRRAKREKKNWYSRNFTQCENQDKNRRESRRRNPAWQAIFWLLLGAASLAAGGCIAFYTGSGQITSDEEIKTEIQAGKWLKEEEEEAGKEREEGWEKEFFGVHIRIREGRISIFREREEMKKITN